MLEKLFQTKYHVPLKLLGQKDWLDIEVDPETGAATKIQSIEITKEDKQKYTPEEIELAFILKRKAGMSAADMFTILAMSKAIANGPKLFRPTFEQCVALENTEIRIPFDFYQQPYPTVILEIPKEYRDRITKIYNCKESPAYVICHRDEKSKTIGVVAWFSEFNVIVNIMSPKKMFETIEESLVYNRRQNSTLEAKFEALRKDLKDDVDFKKMVDFNIDHFTEDNEDDKVEFEIAELVQRLGINFSLMMTMLGVTVVGPVNTTEERVLKQQKILTKKNSNADEKHRATRLLSSVVYLTEFKQKIDFYEVKEHKERSEHETGRKVKPHWRKGHMRLQPYGPLSKTQCNHEFITLTPEMCEDLGFKHPGYLHYVRKCSICNEITFRKLLFIKPIMVKKEFFVGDLSNTTVEYNPHKK